MQSMAALPSSADIVVAGGGTAGAAVAARLATGSNVSVLLIEPGPDYGPYEAGGWPPALLDAARIPAPDHDWNYTSVAKHGEPGHRLDRARVLGGCSAHSGCAAIWGSRADYNGWEQMRNPGWGTDSLLPLFREASERLRVRRPPLEAL
ncbi:MAG TPA: GMC family oxidoreductase N-terminal domain-containing protein, partial [Steroidobacteraceae bacterium]|nr:GMC family oxidoreductase N-terminal domain-containing protein [Steroidobacteraceae bacterium]